MRVRFVLPLAYSLLGIVAAVLHVSNHGGVAGDYVLTDGIWSDAITDQADLGQVFFNRWRLSDQSDSPIVWTFLYLGVPSFLLAKTTLWLVALVIDEMNRTFPFGLSYLSYLFSVGVLLAPIQWYWIGRTF